MRGSLSLFCVVLSFACSTSTGHSDQDGAYDSGRRPSVVPSLEPVNLTIEPLRICLPSVRSAHADTDCQTLYTVDQDGVLSRIEEGGEIRIFGTFTQDGRLVNKGVVSHRLWPDGRVTHAYPRRPRSTDRFLRVQLVADDRVRVTSLMSVTSATQEDDATWRIDGAERTSGSVTLQRDGTLVGEGIHLPHTVLGVHPKNMRFATFATIVSVAMLPSVKTTSDRIRVKPAISETDEVPTTP